MDVEVPNNQEVHVNESVSYNYHLQGNATFVIETQTSIIISPSEIVDNKETTINIQGSTTSNSITIQSFEKANVHLSNDSPLKINDVSEIHLSKESGSINIGEVKTDKTDIAITSTISTNVERVLFIGSRTITVSENIEVSNIEMSESIEGTIKSSRISGTTNIVRGSILHATDCEFTSDSIISFNIESIGETNKLILASTSSSSKFIQTLASSFNAKEINIDIHDSERNGESTLIEGLGDTCSNYLSVVHVNKEGFTTSCTSELYILLLELLEVLFLLLLLSSSSSFSRNDQRLKMVKVKNQPQKTLEIHYNPHSYSNFFPTKSSFLIIFIFFAKQ